MLVEKPHSHFSNIFDPLFDRQRATRVSWTDLKKSESEKIHKQIPSSIPQDGNNILHNPADEEEG